MKVITSFMLFVVFLTAAAAVHHFVQEWWGVVPFIVFLIATAMSALIFLDEVW